MCQQVSAGAEAERTRQQKLDALNDVLGFGTSHSERSRVERESRKAGVGPLRALRSGGNNGASLACGSLGCEFEETRRADGGEA